jgi:hypothetical protein
MRLAGLRFLIGDHLHDQIIPGVGLSITLFFFFLLSLTLTYRNSMVSKNWELRFGVCHKKVKLMHSFNGKPASRRFRNKTK